MLYRIACDRSRVTGIEPGVLSGRASSSLLLDQGTVVTRSVERGTLRDCRDVVTLHTLRLSGTRLPKGGLVRCRTDHLDVLHHAAILVTKDVAVQHKLTGEVDGLLTDPGIARAGTRSAAPTDRHRPCSGRDPVALPRQLRVRVAGRIAADTRTCLLRLAVVEDRPSWEVPTVPLIDQRNRILPHR